MQSTPAVKEASSPIGGEGENVWDIWPYCWAIDGWDIMCEHVEQYRTQFMVLKLARFNRRAPEKFCRKNWSARFLAHWHRTTESDERDLKLV